jgi:maltose O-acetyltransferase
MSSNNGAGPKAVAQPGMTSSARFAEADAKYADQIKSMTARQKSLVGLPYLANDDNLIELRTNARNLCREYNQTPSGPITPGEKGANDLTNVKRREILGKLFEAPPEAIKRIFIEPPFFWYASRIVLTII